MQWAMEFLNLAPLAGRRRDPGLSAGWTDEKKDWVGAIGFRGLNRLCSLVRLCV